MKKVFIILTLILMSVSLSAQVAGGKVTYKMGSFYLDGQKIEKERLADVFGYNYPDAKKVLSRRAKGIRQVCIGGALTVTGVAWSAAFGNSDFEHLDPDDFVDSIIMAGYLWGPITAVSGFVMATIGSVRLATIPLKGHNVAKAYNKRNDIALNFGATNSGAGISLVF